jgi:hypothetical protein
MSFIRKIRKGDRTYLAEVESHRVEGKVVQRFIRYVGKDLNSTYKVITTSILRPEESLVDGLEDGFLFFGERHDAG